MRSDRRSKGQSTAEYAIVLSIVLAAVIGMQTYMKRGLQGRYKSVTDAMTSTPAASPDGTITVSTGPTQYEPYYARESMTTARNDGYTESRDSAGISKTGLLSKVSRSVGGFQAEEGHTALASDDDWLK